MTRIEQLRRIVERHQAARVDGFMVDATTANMLVTVHDALGAANQERFQTIDFMRLVDFGWKHVKAGGAA